MTDASRDGWTGTVAETAGLDSLESAATRLLARQASDWPLLAEGLAGLTRARTKLVRVGEASFAVRHIPHRMKSTTARVDAGSIAARPCFLCPHNLPPAQRGVAFGEEWVALCNPFPILERHMTIVHRAHVPQRLSGRIEALVRLAAALPGSFVIYNGPACGASAPDHMHFQSCAWTLLPLAEYAHARPAGLLAEHPSRPIVLRSPDTAVLAAAAERMIDALGRLAPQDGEPLVNLAALSGAEGHELFLFARRRHRPDAFHRGELLVSPAAVDLAGVLVTPRQEDFERIDGERVRDLLDEVVLDRATLSSLALSAAR